MGSLLTRVVGVREIVPPVFSFLGYLSDNAGLPISCVITTRNKHTVYAATIHPG